MHEAITNLRPIDHVALGRSEQALLRCEFAKKEVEAGDYEAARDALGELWQGVGARPRLEDLDQYACAEVLMRAGVVSGWLGSVHQTEGAQERAKDLIGEALTLFQSLDAAPKIFEARMEMAWCYWRQGAFDEARIMLLDTRTRFSVADGDLMALAMVRAAVVERSAGRLSDALTLLNEAAPLVEASQNESLKGNFHITHALVLSNLGDIEGRDRFADRVLIEFTAASFHFEQAGHTRYQARVENNLGFEFLIAGRHQEAGEHLERARRLFARLKDRGSIAQVDETRARVFLARGRNKEAEQTSRQAVRTLEQGDQLALLSEALTTHGVALARLHQPEAAQAALLRAIDTAQQAADRRGEGLAALTLIEECGEYLDPADLRQLYESAERLLASYPQTAERLRRCARMASSSADADCVAERARALHQQAWGLRSADARRALGLSLEAYRLSESVSDRRGKAYALRASGACHLNLGDHESALADLTEALRLFEDLQDREGEAGTLNHIGNAAKRAGDYRRAMDCHQRSHQLYVQLHDRQGQSASLNSIGAAYAHLCDYATALDYLLRSLRLREELGDPQLLAHTLNNIGCVYEKLSDHQKALEYFVKASEVYQETSGRHNEGTLQTNIGGIYCLMGDYENALAYHLRGLKGAQEVGDRSVEASALKSIGDDYRGLGNLEEALNYYFRSLEIGPPVAHHQAEALINIATIFVEQGEIEKAVEYLTRSLAIAGDIGHGELIYRAHHTLSRAYELKGDYREALEQHKAFYHWRSNVLGEEAEKKLQSVLIRAAVEQSEKEAEIYRLRNVEMVEAHRALEEMNGENLRLLEQLRRQADVLERQSKEDALTGLSNRRHLNEQMPQEFDRARRLGHDLSVVMCDIDHFKRVNDRYSHQAGDEVIKRVASVLREQCRKIDVVARYGGEEFALLLIETSPEDALHVCERIRKAVEAYAWERVHPGLKVTVSMGVAGNATFNSPERQLAAADRKLYEAKEAGRNRVRA